MLSINPQSVATRNWLHRNPDKVREYQTARKRRRKNLSEWPVLALYTIKNRAKVKGLEFSLVPADIVVPLVCPILGIPLVVASGKAGPNSPSIDRKDNTKGYVKGNVYVISRRANIIKNDATPAELRAIIAYMER